MSYFEKIIMRVVSKKKETIYLTRLDIDLIELTICNEVGNFLIRWKARRFVKDFVSEKFVSVKAHVKLVIPLIGNLVYKLVR